MLVLPDFFWSDVPGHRSLQSKSRIRCNNCNNCHHIILFALFYTLKKELPKMYMEIKHEKKEKERMGRCEKTEKGWWSLVTTVIQFKAKNKYNIYFQLAGYTVSFSEHLLGEHVTQVYYCCTDRIVPTVKGWLKKHQIQWVNTTDTRLSVFF